MAILNLHGACEKRVVRLQLLSAAFVLAWTSTANALVITTTDNATTLVNNILGTGPTVVGAPSYSGASSAPGTFTGGVASGIGIESGIILTTGNAADAVGPNSNANDSSEILSGTVGGTGSNSDIFDDTTTAHGTSGDSALDTLAGVSTFDAAILNFDFSIASAGNLAFDFVFASEEYLDFVNRGPNDVFGFFIDGVNIGVVPGTTTPISVDTVNPLSNSGSFVNNVTGLYDVEYDGFTSVITAEALGLTAGTHSMKLAIADGLDTLLDAAVFIEQGSFTVTETDDGGDDSMTVPEPPAIALFGITFAGMAWSRRRKGRPV